MQNKNYFVSTRQMDISCLETLETAMAYVPFQNFCKAYPLCKGLQVGTIFPDLDKPFCGKGGRCR